MIVKRYLRMRKRRMQNSGTQQATAAVSVRYVCLTEVTYFSFYSRNFPRHSYTEKALDKAVILIAYTLSIREGLIVYGGS